MQEKLEQYKSQATHYLQNALITLQQGDAEKTSEFLWGGIAEALKAVAARKGNLLRNHKEIRAFAHSVSVELQEPSLETAFIAADRLHSNFYESFLALEDLARDAERIKEAVGRLLELLEVPVEGLPRT